MPGRRRRLRSDRLGGPTARTILWEIEPRGGAEDIYRWKVVIGKLKDTGEQYRRVLVFSE